MIEDVMYEAILEATDRSIDICMPAGVSDDPALEHTNKAFDFYIARHGIPQTANQARHMFEFAAAFILISDATRTGLRKLLRQMGEDA